MSDSDSKQESTRDLVPRGTRKPPNAGKGRKKGSVNKATSDVRRCVAMIAENLGPEVEGWIRRGARKRPLEAARVLADLLEFHIPKLSRIESDVNLKTDTTVTLNVSFKTPNGS